MPDAPPNQGASSHTPWAIRPELASMVAAALRSAAPVRDVEVAPPKSATTSPAESQPTAGVAVLSLKGILRPGGGGLLGLLFGMGGGLDRFRSSFAEAMGNPDVTGVLINVDSPGGSTDLIAETAAEVRDARGTKPIVAVANTMAASAAYWIASQADELVVTPSGEVGSIGVFAMHDDLSKMDEMMGIKTTLISAGKFKTEGNPFEPLTDEARAAIQQSVDDFYGMFVADVAKGRNVKASEVRGGFGEGRMATAKRAVELGMADRVATFEDTAARLADSRRRARIGTASDDETAKTRARDSRALQLAHERRL